ncbi:UNVERIFIED_CONTAM: hypothetical protein FKN15_023976 [Acipenser sinensis]
MMGWYSSRPDANGQRSVLCQVGEAHEKTRESSEYLKYLTQQAVALQRTMNEIYKNGSSASIMPLKVGVVLSTPSLLKFELFFSDFVFCASSLQFTAPTMASVLEQLNIINGIIFIPLSQKDLENLKAEVQRRQQLQEAMKSEEQQEEESPLELEHKLTAEQERQSAPTGAEVLEQQASA